jgi:hypothetical protein
VRQQRPDLATSLASDGTVTIVFTDIVDSTVLNARLGDGVKIIGYSNPGQLAASASSLYAKNLYAFLEILIDKKAKALAVNWDDDIVKATVLTRNGAVVHPNFQPKSAA